MKKRIYISLIIASFLVANAAVAEDLSSRVAESRQLIQELGKNLKGSLVKAMKASGPTGAIEACNLAAPSIEGGLSSDHGMKIGRTSLKVRNYRNNPDAWELTVLEGFESRLAKGEDPGKIDHAEIVVEGNKSFFRYMKAIPTDEVCLKCHGENLAPAVADKLDGLYPYDKARGFKKGAIRGAFTVLKPL